MVRKTDCEGFYRRDFLRIGAAGIFGLSLPQLLQMEARAQATRNGNQPRDRRATSVIMVWLAGGPATIDMWDLRPNAPDNIRGEFKGIDTRINGYQISEHLPRMAGIADKATFVRSLAHTIPSHGPATVFMTTGNKPTPALQYPALGSLVTRLLPPAQGVPPYVTFSELRNGSAGQAGYLGTAYNPFIVEGAGAGGGRGTAGTLRVRGISLPTGFTLEQLENRDRLLQSFDRGFQAADRNADLVDGLDAFHRQALEILRSDRTRNAFNLAQESDSVRQRYGQNSFGQGALAARRLIEAGVRFVTISMGGWDTHNQTFQAHKTRLLPQLDQTLSALIEDLDTRGQLDNTIVYCAGEFGLRRGSISGLAAITGLVRWPSCWRAVVSVAATSTAPPMSRAWPRPRIPAPQTTSLPPSSIAWVWIRTRNCRPRPAGPSSSSAKVGSFRG
jgi:hypothetical protein